ncbi:MAG: tetratricopeptide repeat protein [Desulfovibrionaceae bacterium]|nr:tetratricopeptide repeat protein [Desulfovibrionaceae bacterium]
MSDSSSVWIFAALAVALVVVFSASLYWAAGGRGRRVQSLAVALIALLAVEGLYAARGEPAALNPPAHGPAGAPDPNQMVRSLAERLKEHPEDLDGWIMLARSYAVLDRYAEAADAYEHAQERVMQDGGLLANWIELRLIVNRHKFDARTHELVERVTAMAPDEPDVLLLRALAASDRGEQAQANELVDKLRQHYPPGTPDRQNLDAALEQWMGPQGQAPAQPGAPGQSASSPASDAPDMNTAVQRLADRLKEHPEDMDGWLMLARSYNTLGRYAEAADAYEHAQERVMQDGSLLADWIELRLMLAHGKLDTRTHKLIEKAAALTPGDPRVAVLRALAEQDRGSKPDLDALVRTLRERHPSGTPERKSLDAMLERIMPQAAGKP